MKSGAIESLALHQRCESFQTLLRDLDVMRRLHRTAERHARLPPGSPQGHDLVMEAVEDMIMGDVSCDADGSLATQLHDEVRRRANRLRRDAQRASFIALDEAPASALIADPDQEGTSRDELGVPDAPALVRSIRDQAHNDAPVLQLLALYERDIVLRRDVLRAGMKPWIFRYARKRLSQYAAAALARSCMPADVPLREDPQHATLSPQVACTGSEVPVRILVGVELIPQGLGWTRSEGVPVEDPPIERNCRVIRSDKKHIFVSAEPRRERLGHRALK